MSENHQNEDYFKKKAELSNRDITELVGENAFNNSPEPPDPNTPPAPPNPNTPPDPNTPPAPPDPNTPPVPPVEMTDEQLIEALKKRNVGINSIEDLQKINQNQPPEPPDPEAKKKSIREFASQKNFDVSLFDNYENDIKKDPIEVLFEQYKSDRSGEVNSEQEPLTEEELRSEFEIEYNLNLEDEDPMKKRSLKQIAILRDVILKDRYKSINDIESEFETDSNSRLSNAEHQNEIQTAKANIIQNGLKYDLKVIDDENNPIQINLPIKKEILDTIEVPVGAEDVQSSILNQYIAKNIGAILYEVSQSYHSQMIEKLAASGQGVIQRHTDDLAKSGMLVNDTWKTKFSQAGIKTD